MKFSTQDKQSEDVSDINEDFSLVNKSRNSDVEESRGSQENTKFDCRKRLLTIMISLILVVLGKDAIDLNRIKSICFQFVS